VNSSIAVRGKLKGRHIELDEPIDDFEGEVEVCVRAADNATARAPRLLEVIAAMPVGRREKADMDAELACERDSWDGRI